MKTRLATLTFLDTFDLANCEQLGKVNEVKCLPDLSAQVTMKLSNNTRLVKVFGFVHHVASYTKNFRQMDEYSSTSQNKK